MSEGVLLLVTSSIGRCLRVVGDIAVLSRHAVIAKRVDIAVLSGHAVIAQESTGLTLLGHKKRDQNDQDVRPHQPSRL